MVDPGVINDFCKEFMPDLSAKVFRTYNASFTLERELSRFDPKELVDPRNQDELLKFYNEANRKVAILCNHQKAVGKGHGDSIKKMQGGLDDLQEQLDMYKKHLKAQEDKKNPAVEADANRTDDEAYMKFIKALPKDKEATKKKMVMLKQRIEKKANEMDAKEMNKNVSLTTSRINYMDPRITISWCKKWGLDVKKIFSQSVIVKFPWAMDVSTDYKFFTGDGDIPPPPGTDGMTNGTGAVKRDFSGSSSGSSGDDSDAKRPKFS